MDRTKLVAPKSFIYVRAPKSFIHVRQFPTVAIFYHKGNGYTLNVTTKHHKNPSTVYFIGGKARCKERFLSRVASIASI